MHLIYALWGILWGFFLYNASEGNNTDVYGVTLAGGQVHSSYR